MPSQLDEQNTYDNVLHWTWTASDKTPEFATTYGGHTGTGQDVHNDVEGDDCWTHYEQFRRTSLTVFDNWATGTCNLYFRDGDYLFDVVNGDEITGRDFDHAYGEGLVLRAHVLADSAALTAAENIAAYIEDEHDGDVPGVDVMQYYGLRGPARHLLVMTYVAQESSNAHWDTVRDHIIDLFIQAPNFEAGADGGMYFVGADEMANISSGDFDSADWNAGVRLVGTFHIGIAAEAHWRAYLATGRADVRQRIIDMADWVMYYAYDNATWTHPMPGATIGQLANLARYDRDDGGTNSADTKSTDPSWSTNLVNLHVMAYKLTGNSAYLTRAQYLFRRGTRHLPGGSAENPNPLVPLDEVHHFVDTWANGTAAEFEWNKGELRYTYLLFENGGVPTVL
jgi:hypothetical protein